ncbi:BQ5605_C036g11523 [Microbotryum silenes-dioicae]|uniref:BQ5605_C036g11523 protein n=1 Tax=Microbotryum silenes-dioicae TaxID=796604 RepID=A0A2X0MJY2_9BASI|nr:BQ5605_C036g11523 [Microbotryum silenes-dioicae]
MYGPPFGQPMDLRARGYLRVTIRLLARPAVYIRARTGHYTRYSALMRAQPTQSTRFLGFFQK